jgi:hypothetical protein
VGAFVRVCVAERVLHVRTCPPPPPTRTHIHSLTHSHPYTHTHTHSLIRPTHFTNALLHDFVALADVCENFNPHQNSSVVIDGKHWPDDCTGTKFYHWGALAGMISLIEEGYW